MHAGRVYLVQSGETGEWLIPFDGYLDWTPDLELAMRIGRCDREEAQYLLAEVGDWDTKIVFVGDGGCE